MLFASDSSGSGSSNPILRAFKLEADTQGTITAAGGENSSLATLPPAGGEIPPFPPPLRAQAPGAGTNPPSAAAARGRLAPVWAGGKLSDVEHKRVGQDRSA
jgi:hypothetical protein